MRVQFSIHEFDSEGDISEEGIFLHFDGARIKVGEDMDSYRAIIVSLQAMESEVEEHFNNGGR